MAAPAALPPAATAGCDVGLPAGRACRDHERAEPPDGGAEPDEASDERDEREDAQDAESRQERQHPMPRRGDEPPAERERADRVAEPVQEPEREQDAEADRDPDEEPIAMTAAMGIPISIRNPNPIDAPSRRAAVDAVASAALGTNSTSTRPRRNDETVVAIHTRNRPIAANWPALTSKRLDRRTRPPTVAELAMTADVPGDHVAADAALRARRSPARSPRRRSRPRCR